MRLKIVCYGRPARTTFYTHVGNTSLGIVCSPESKMRLHPSLVYEIVALKIRRREAKFSLHYLGILSRPRLKHGPLCRASFTGSMFAGSCARPTGAALRLDSTSRLP